MLAQGRPFTFHFSRLMVLREILSPRYDLPQTGSAFWSLISLYGQPGDSSDLHFCLFQSRKDFFPAELRALPCRHLRGGEQCDHATRTESCRCVWQTRWSRSEL